MSHWLRNVLPLLCLAWSTWGCASVESTMVTRDETNQYWERHNCLNGIPITLKVPTHLKIYVFHKHYIEPSRQGEEIVGYESVDVGVVVRDFAQEFMYTDKIFVVDFKRPAAGSSNLKVKMTDQQYIDAIQHDITDNTINDVRGLIAAASGGTFEAVSEQTPGPKPRYTEIRSLVAVGIFEIDSPDFEQKVRDFMTCHVNKSHDAWTVPLGVESVNRVGRGENQNGRYPYPDTSLCEGDELNPELLPHGARAEAHEPYPVREFTTRTPPARAKIAGP